MGIFCSPAGPIKLLINTDKYMLRKKLLMFTVFNLSILS